MGLYVMPANFSAEVAEELIRNICAEAAGKFFISFSDFRREIPVFRRLLHKCAFESVIGL